jgi:hypothetical protein
MDRISTNWGSTSQTDEKIAVEEIFNQISDNKDGQYIIFCSPEYNTESLGKELFDKFGPDIFCCTTSGEISKSGYSKGGIVGLKISSSEIKFKNYFIQDITNIDLKRTNEIAENIKKEFNINDFDPARHTGMILIDGLSMLEDKVISLFSKSLDPIEISGGSAGDNLNFQETHIYNGGKFYKNSVSFLFIESEIPFLNFRTQHFEPTEKKLVITEADPAKRIVYEINGEKAAIEYANILGIEVTSLNPQVFARYPVMLNIGNSWYIRSIAKMNDDYSLSFFCAIDNGLVLTVAQGDDITKNLDNTFKILKKQLGEISVIIAFDCILRKLEVEQNKIVDNMNEVFSKVNVIGFSTYGEQCNSVHVNQTLTGLAFGS